MQFSSQASKSATPEEKKIPEPLTNPAILYTGVSRNKYCGDQLLANTYIFVHNIWE